MTSVGIMLCLLGYWVGYGGLNHLTGGNDGFLDLGIPGHFKQTAPKDLKGQCPGVAQKTLPITPGNNAPLPSDKPQPANNPQEPFTDPKTGITGMQTY